MGCRKSNNVDDKDLRDFQQVNLVANNAEYGAAVIDGLWALSFAPATATAIDPNRLYFTAGPDKETDGLFGYLIKQ